MGDWKILMDLDDDYLIGMANKGIVKRAYKDMEAGDYKVLSEGGEARVSVGGETVMIRQPLGESTCSCPSRTVCRHVVLGILALREYVGKAAGGEGGSEAAKEKTPGGEQLDKTNIEMEDTAGGGQQGAEIGQEDASVAGGQPGEETEREGKTACADEKQTDGVEETVPADKECSREKSVKTKTLRNAQSEKKEQEKAVSGSETSEKPKDLKARLLADIAAYPLASLKKILSAKQLFEIAGQMKAGQVPEIAYSSVASVKLPKGGYTVKLLSPLEYSTCTCHKKEFCAHKAAALLWCKLTEGQVKTEELGTAEEAQEYDFGQIKDAAGQMRAFLEELLDTGLARTSPDVLDYLDRLALVSHNARLANFEGYWRALHDSYGNYLARKASFRVRTMMEQFARLYQRVEALEKSSDAMRVYALAGEFRSEYAPAGNLSLAGIAMEHFESQTGYEGETVYFLEENTKEWYTYTSARPVFYESSQRRRRQEKAGAPWGIPVSIEELDGLRIHLYGARADMRGRLSASADTKGEVTGNCRKENCLHTKDLGCWYYRDFGKLFEEQVEKKRMPWFKGAKEERRDGELVFLRPYSFTRGEFSETEQKLTMELYDAAGREVILELAYSKREEWGIEYLERLTEEKEPCFLGKLYFKDGRMRLYPVTVFEKGELREDFGDWEKEEAGQMGSFTTEKPDESAEMAEFGTETAADALKDVLEDAGSLLEEMYQSGLDTVHDSTLEGLENMQKLAKQYGLFELSALLVQMAEGSAARRHRLKREKDTLAATYAKACEYLYLCREKTAVDKGWEYYGKNQGNTVFMERGL